MGGRIFDKLRNILLIYGEYLRAGNKGEYKDPALRTLINSQIWSADFLNSPFGFTTTFQACAAYDPDRGYHVVNEHISIFDSNPLKTDRHHRYALNLSSSFREAVFHVEQYNKRMREYGFTPVMGSEQNLLPNINSVLQEMMDRKIPSLEWLDKMACMGIYDMHKVFGDYRDAPPTTMRFIDFGL